MRNVLLLGGALALLVGCGGSDGMDTPPANVEGMWSVDVTNAGSARLTGCTGDLVSFEGFTVAGLAASAPGCEITQSEVTQFETSFTVTPYSVVCSDGSTASGAGGGTVNGNSITGQEDLFWTSGVGRQRLFRGAVDGSNLEIDMYRMIFAGGIVGSCDFNPNLHFSGTIGADVSDPPGPDVILEVEALDNPPVTATLNPQTGICTFTISDWSFQAANIPKSAAAGESSFNDISLTNVVITYSWSNTSLSTPTRTVGLGGVVVPVNGTNIVEFAPIAFDDLSGAFQGSTANLTMTFNAITVEGLAVSATVFRQLSIEQCS